MQKLVTLFLLLLISIVSITAKDIKGRVSNSEYTMLQNVYIYLKNDPSFSVLTNENGEFVISLKRMKYLEEDIIIFSHMGYETKEYQIKELSDNICHEIILIEGLMMLEGVVVMGDKLSRKEKKNRKKSVIKQFKEQVEKDFIFENRTYKVVSDFEVTRDVKRIFYNKLIGEYKEVIGVLPDKTDSISLTYTGIINHLDNDIELGVKKMSDRFVDNNVVSKKRKKNKRVLGSLFYKTVLSDSVMLKEVLRHHKFFWSFNRNIKKRVQKLDDNPKKWEIIEANEKTVLRYKHKRGLLGIVKFLSITDFIVERVTYSLEEVVEDVSAELNIPFGYKLPPDALMLLNLVSTNSEDMKKYRARHLNVDATFNTIYKKIDTSKYMDEMAYDLDMSIIDTRKRNIKGESKILVKVVAIEDN